MQFTHIVSAPGYTLNNFNKLGNRKSDHLDRWDFCTARTVPDCLSAPVVIFPCNCYPGFSCLPVRIMLYLVRALGI